MDEREEFDARQEAMRETAGKVSRSTRERMWEGLAKYLAAEARHARKSAGSEQESERKKDQDRRSP